MKRYVAIFVMAIAAIAFTVQAADARHRKIDKRVKTTSLVAGAAATAGYFAINNWHWGNWHSGSISQGGALAGTTIACAAGGTILATAVVNRPLTTREAYYMVGNCVVPIIGGWLVNQWFDANPHWEGKTAAKRVKRKKKA
jgi:hypothetical protein